MQLNRSIVKCCPEQPPRQWGAEPHLPPLSWKRNPGEAMEVSDQRRAQALDLARQPWHRLIALAAMLGALPACERRSVGVEQGRPQEKSANDQASKLAAPATQPKGAEPLIDLLRRTDAELVVSSHQDENHRAVSLADGRAETSFRPNPPDPAPWIEVILPTAVNVRSIELLPTGKQPAPDRSFAVIREGHEVGLLGAEGERLHFATPEPWPGGRIRLAWKAKDRRRVDGFSRLSVWGDAPASALLPEATPSAHVQRSRSAYDPWWLSAPYPSLQALCAKYHELRSARPEEASLVDKSPPSESRCALDRTLQPTGQSPPGMLRAHLAVVARGPLDELGSSPVFPKVLLFETNRGWFPTDVVVDSDRGSADDRGSVAYVTRVHNAAWIDGRLELDVLSRLLISGGYPPDGPLSVSGRFVISCEVKQRPVCRDELIAYGDPAMSPFILIDSTRWHELQQMPKQWLWTRAHFVAPSGNLRLGDCMDGQPGKSGSVPCFAPDTSRLR